MRTEYRDRPYALQLTRGRPIKTLPVVDRHKRIVGIFSLADSYACRGESDFVRAFYEAAA